jgi:mannitol/fructose-specific phosphotransferase system IIA component (Ntr-type)
MRATNIIDHVLPAHCLTNLEGTSREEVIDEMADAFVASGTIDAGARDVIVASVLEREEAATTGIANGVALPHPKDPGDVVEFLDEVLIGVGLHPTGVDFGAPDGELIRLVFLVASPDKQAYLESARRIVALAMGGSQPEKWRRVIRGCPTPAALREALEEAWEELAP